MERGPGNREPVSVFIVSDVRIYREGIASNLAHCRDLTVLGTSAGTTDTIERVSSTRPDIIVIDVSATQSPALVRALQDRPAPAKIVAFGVEESEDEILCYAESGVAGYVSRDASMNELIAIIMSVARGELICSPRIAATLFRRVGSLATGRTQIEPNGVLTIRERQVLDCLRESLSNKEIANRLHIAEATVKNHVHNLLGKLQITRRAHALKSSLPMLPARRAKGTSTLD
jgi:two-component system, NarL family, nitrate/nitrite response regulator NarL